MALETAITINQLDPANPAGPDRLANGDDHIRMIKLALKNTFPNLTGPMNLTEAFLHSLQASPIPVGTIMLWTGTILGCPAGFAICDGTNGTPDMRGRVPVGTTVARATGVLFGQEDRTVTSGLGGAHNHVGNTSEGGSHSHTVTVAETALTVAQMPAHTHTVKNGSGQGTIAAEGGAGGQQYSQTTDSAGSGAGHTHTAQAVAGGNHTHTLAVEAVPAHAHAVAFDVVQPSISLHFIMKV